MWFDEGGYGAIVVILVKLYFGFKVIGVETFVFDLKSIEGQDRGNREGLEYTLWHAYKLIERQDNQVFV